MSKVVCQINVLGKSVEICLSIEYNSNNFCIELLEFDIDHNKVLDREI